VVSGDVRDVDEAVDIVLLSDLGDEAGSVTVDVIERVVPLSDQA
jgi:hypothetical protein